MIRTPLPADADRLGEIHVAAWRWAYRGIIPDQELFVDRTVARSVARWRERLANPLDTLVFDDGILKGFVIQGPTRDQDLTGVWEVMALNLEPAFTRGGVGTALIRASEAAARKAGFRQSTLWVLEANARARAFYEKNGYRPDGSLKVIDEWNKAVELRYAKVLD